MSYLSLSTANRAATRKALLFGTVSLAAPSGFGVTRVTSLPTVTPRLQRHAVAHHDLVRGRADTAGGEVSADGGVFQEIGRLHAARGRGHRAPLRHHHHVGVDRRHGMEHARDSLQPLRESVVVLQRTVRIFDADMRIDAEDARQHVMAHAVHRRTSRGSARRRREPMPISEIMAVKDRARPWRRARR